MDASLDLFNRHSHHTHSDRVETFEQFERTCSVLLRPAEATRGLPAAEGVIGPVSRVPRILRTHPTDAAADGRTALLESREVTVRPPIAVICAPWIERETALLRA